MARDLTTTQYTNVENPATRPIYLVEWQYSGTTEYLSASGAVTYDGQAYTAGGIRVTSIDDSKIATLSLQATSTRITQIQNNAWRGGICKITAILAAPGETPTYAAADGVLLLDGIIESVNFAGETITVTAKCKYYLGALTPRFTFNDVVTNIPAVGSTSSWNSETFSYEQWLITTAAIQRLVKPGVNPQVVGRASAAQVNDFASSEQSGYRLISAQGVHIPIVYGRASVPGFIFAEGTYASGNYLGVAWCVGEIYQVEAVFINDEPIPASCVIVHYNGSSTQEVSPGLQGYINTSPQFNDDMVLHLPQGDLGIAYSAVWIPTGAITGAPRFRAIIQGRLVEDPSSTATDPYSDLVEYSYDFTTGLSDSGPNNYTLTLNGDAGISSPSIGLELDGTGDYATIPDGGEIGSQNFSLEIEAWTNTVSGSPVTAVVLFNKGLISASPGSLSFRVTRYDNGLYFYGSSDGLTWDIANGISCGTISGSPSTVFRILIERADNRIITYMDGQTVATVTTTAAFYDNSLAWELGASGGVNEFEGGFKSVRLTIGAYRYGAQHSITNSPFSDSGNYTAGVVYSEKPALCWNDLAKNPYFGLNATTTGVEDAVAYGDSLLDTGVPRCRIGIVISEVRQVERWLDTLAMYANCVYFPEGSNLKIVPDKIKDGTNGSGKELYSAMSPEFGSPLPTVTTEDGVSYSVCFEITAESSDSPMSGVSVWFGGVEIITSEAGLGKHGATVTASGTSNTIEVIEDVGFDGTWASLSVKRTHRLIDKWMPSTLSLQGMPEGDKPNAVLVKYTVPDDTSGAWVNQQFGTLNSDAVNGEPIVLTTIDMPGVYRIEEASNKAIANLYRQDRKVRVSAISTDEEVVCQPCDTVQFYSSHRGVDTPVWVETARMVSYGRFEIVGTIYRDNQYPDTSYSDGGRFVEGGYAEELGAGNLVCTYTCDAFDTKIAEYSPTSSANGNDCDAYWDGTKETFPWPFAADNTERSTNMRYETNFIAGGNAGTSWGTTQTNRGCNISTLSSWNGNWNSNNQLGFCGIPDYVGSVRGPTTGINAFIPSGDSLGATGGDYNATVIFTGWNGDDSSNFPLLRNTNRKVSYTTTISTSGVSDVPLYINVGGTAGARTLDITCGEGTTAVNESYSIGTVGDGVWHLFHVRVSTSVSIIPGSGSGTDLEITARVTGFVVPSSGDAVPFDVSGSRVINPGTTAGISSWSWSTNFGAGGGIFYGRPNYFYMGSTSGQASFAYIGFDTDPELTAEELASLERAFKGTFVNYSGPCW